MKINPIEAEYIESGTFQAGEEDCFNFGRQTEAIILRLGEFEYLLNEIDRLRDLVEFNRSL